MKKPSKIRKPYRPPVVRTEKLYEQDALACAKVVGQPPPPGRGLCRKNPRMS